MNNFIFYKCSKCKKIYLKKRFSLGSRLFGLYHKERCLCNQKKHWIKQEKREVFDDHKNIWYRKI